MKRLLTVVLVIALLAGITAIVMAAPPAPRSTGCCVWANSKVYWFLGNEQTLTDSTGMVFGGGGGASGISIYTPSSNSWVSSKYDGTGPVGLDTNFDGKCTWADDLRFYSYCNAGATWNGKIYNMCGWQTYGAIYAYDPTVGNRGAWSYAYQMPSGWEGFRRGAVAQNGSKVYMCSGAGSAGFIAFDLANGNVSDFGFSGPDVTRCNATFCDNKMYIVGGAGSASAGGNGIWMSNVSTGTPTAFTQVATLPVTELQFPMVVSYNHKVYVLGGMDSGTASDKMYVLNTTNNGLSTQTLPFAKSSGGAAVDPATGTIYVGGGGSGGDAYNVAAPEQTWFKADLDDATPTFTAIANDPAYIPYEDFNTGIEFSGIVVDDVTGNPIKYAFVNIGDRSVYKRVLTDATGKFEVSVPNTEAAIKTYELLTADAWQYANKDQLVRLDQHTTPITIRLTPKVEISAIPNADMESVDETTGIPTSWANGPWAAGTQTITSVTPGHGGTGKCASVDVPTAPGWQETWLNQTFPIAPGQYNYWLWRKYVAGWDVYGEQYWIYNTDGGELVASGWNTGDRHGASGLSDPDGFFRLDANQTIYRIDVPADAATFQIATASLASDSQITQLVDDLILEPVEATLGTATGRVVDTHGVGIADAYVAYKGSPNALMDAGQNDWVKTDGDGYYTVTIPVGEYFFAAFKEGFTPSSDALSAVNGNAAAPTITLQAGKENIVLNRPDMLLTSNNLQDPDTLDNAVDGSPYTLCRLRWNDGYGPDDPYTGEDFGPAQWMIASFDGATNLSDIVLYREAKKGFGDDYQNYELQVMYAGNPSDNLSWEDPSSTVETIYSKNHSIYGTKIAAGVGLCAMPVNAHQALGVRVRFLWAHWQWKYGSLADLQIHGDSMYPATAIADAKTLPAETKLAIAGKQLTALCSTDGATNLGVPANTAFVENADRSNGIRIDVTGITNLAELEVSESGSSEISVLGTVKTSNGVNYIKADKVRWISAKEPKIAALGMNNRFAGTNLAEGLSVQVWGIATSLPAVPGDDRAIWSLDDGSGTPIKLYTYYYPFFKSGDFISIRGVVTKDANGTVVYATDAVANL